MTATVPFNHKIITTQNIFKGQEMGKVSFIQVGVFFINRLHVKKVLELKERSPNIVEIYDANKDILLDFFYGSLTDFVDLLIDKGIIFLNKDNDLQTKYDNIEDIEKLMAVYDIAC